jgi:U3 small nucleolar RNA-associated protein 12
VQVWSLAELPGGKGFISASADHYLKFWEWGATQGDDGTGATRVTVSQTKAINTGQDVLCVRVSPDGKLVAASLISNVIKVRLPYDR